jgi:hypothetical protein
MTSLEGATVMKTESHFQQMSRMSSYVARSIQSAAWSVVERWGYWDPEEAYCRCVPATERLQERLTPEFVVFRLGVITENQFAEQLFERENRTEKERLWHAVCYVPNVGAVDVTGAQFGKKPIRILSSMPDCWVSVTEVMAPPGLPIELEGDNGLKGHIDLDGEMSSPNLSGPLSEKTDRVRPETVGQRLDEMFDARSGF